MSRIAAQHAEDVEIAPRRSFTPKQRLEILISQKGRCEICKAKIIDVFEIDHRIPLALGGKDDASNWRALHPDCHLNGKTKPDVKRIAKAKAQSKLRLDAPSTRSAAWGSKSRPMQRAPRVAKQFNRRLP
jgi:5-methylcytosine-specific restriction endonuclease McrA